MIVNKDLPSLIKLIKVRPPWSLLILNKLYYLSPLSLSLSNFILNYFKVAEYIGYENVRKAARNHILSKSSNQLSHEIHSQNLKSLIKIFKVSLTWIFSLFYIYILIMALTGGTKINEYNIIRMIFFVFYLSNYLWN